MMEIMRQTDKSKTCVWRWQERFAEQGVDGLLRDKTRPSRIPPLGPEVAERVVARTLADPPGETTHWTADMMAQAAGVSASAVRRIWKAHGLQPHRWRRFKLSNDPKFVDKLRDVVGLYVDPPAHAIVLSIDEKSQIQALDRTQPGLPMKKGRLGTMTHDYKRHGTTTLFAALNVLDGTVIGRNMARHRHQEFIRFLNAVNAELPANMIGDAQRSGGGPGAGPSAGQSGTTGSGGLLDEIGQMFGSGTSGRNLSEGLGGLVERFRTAGQGAKATRGSLQKPGICSRTNSRKRSAMKGDRRVNAMFLLHSQSSRL